ncbi:hypothetical protein DFH28DRAFT_1160712 [Melampsora americana]|nr:hypothetical protein DFH28DRAFT_1160712 [Melampsora americana]
MSQANWSPTTGLNLSKILPSQASHPGPSPMQASPPTWSLIPKGDPPRAEQLVIAQPQCPHPSNNMVFPPASAHLSMGAVWVPNPQLSPEGRVTYAHNLSRPAWCSKDDYHSMLDWRHARVITDDRVAVDFNRVCDAARLLNGLSHQSDPLPWCRDGVNPVHEAHASAKYNVHVLREAQAGLSSGEEESLQRLLADSDEDQVTPGRSVDYLNATRRLVKGPTSASTTSSPSPSYPATPAANALGFNGLIHKGSPVKLSRDLPENPLTQLRFSSIPPGLFAPEDDAVDKFGEPNKGIPAQHSLIPTQAAGHLARSTSMARPARSGCPRKSNGKRSAGTLSHQIATTQTSVPTQPNELANRQPGSSHIDIMEASNEDQADLSLTSLVGSDHALIVGPDNDEDEGPRSNHIENSLPCRFRWPERPGSLDVLWLSFLASTSPFAVAKETTERFRKCAETLTIHPDTKEFFGKMSMAKHSCTLRNRYESLKKWLSKVERKSLSDSGTQEEDSDLRTAIKNLQVQEEELKNITDAAKAVKEGAATALAKANDFRDARAEVTNVGKQGPTTLRALRDGVMDKISNHASSTHMVNVNMKSNSEAAERANELTSLALEQHQEQIVVMSMQRERELAQSQARLDLDSQTARKTINLRREELQATALRIDKKDESISKLKTLMASELNEKPVTFRLLHYQKCNVYRTVKKIIQIEKS